jgi:hypothetical protein
MPVSKESVLALFLPVAGSQALGRQDADTDARSDPHRR